MTDLPADRPRTSDGRLRARYDERLADARAANLDGTAAELAKIDDAYVSGAIVRNLDPETRRLRAQVRADPRTRSRSRRGGDLFVWITEDRDRGVALVRGPGDHRLLLDQCGLLDRAVWSTVGRGWVLSSADVVDLIAFCQWQGIPAQWKWREGPPS